LRGGWVNPRPQVRVLRETPSTVALDADGGLGVAVAPLAMARALDKAAAVGCGFAAVRNSRDSAVLTTGVVGSLITGDVIYWGGLMAGALVAALPPHRRLRVPDGLLRLRPHRRRHQR